MRISRKKKPKKSLVPKYKVNRKITAPEVRILGNDHSNLGVFPIEEALEKAREQEMDLVEINPKSDPPVAKIIDFGNFKYQKEKEVRKQRQKSRVSELKGVRLSIRISGHDMDVRRRQATKFLDRGDKVRIEVMLRGREKGKGHLAYDIIRDFVAKLEEKYPLKYEQEPARQGGKVTAIVTRKS